MRPLPTSLAALLTASLSLGGCSQGTSPAPLTATVTPTHASMFGQTDITLTGDLGRFGTIQSVKVGGIAAVNLRPGASTLTVTLQGAPKPGAADVEVIGSGGSATAPGAFQYDPPRGGAPLKWAAFGASLTQGFQSGGLTTHSQLMSWAAQAARAAGVYLAPALVVDGLLPPLLPSDFVGDCTKGLDEGKLGNGLFGTIYDGGSKTIDLRLARQDWTLPTQNFAIGGAQLSDMLGPAAGPVRVIERITELPDGDPHQYTSPSSLSQVQRMQALDPDVAFSADLLGNDADGAVTASDDLHPEVMTDVATMQTNLGVLAAALGKLHGDYFVANLVDLGMLPNVMTVRTQRLAAMLDTPASFDAKLAQVRATVDAYNAALGAAFAPYPNLHVVDLKTPTSAAAGGFVVGTAMLDGKKFGGLVSLDHLHFTDTAYALTANVFLDAINLAKGWSIPDVDIVAVNKEDALSPAALAAAGVQCRGTP